MDKIVSSETNGGQLCWSFCFADLLKQIITLCPDPVRQAWALVYVTERQPRFFFPNTEGSSVGCLAFQLCNPLSRTRCASVHRQTR